MSRIRQTKTTFTAGEVSRRLLGRGDLRAYENGALSLRNVFIHPTGGVTRRSGLAYIDTAAGHGRLISFEFNTEQTYLLALTDQTISIYLDGTKITSLAAPWTEEQIKQINWTQSADTLLICHPDMMPKKLTRSGAGGWSLDDWEYYTDSGILYQPYYKFADTNVTLTPSGTSGTISLTASASVFIDGHEGVRLRVGGKEVEITRYDSPTVVTVSTVEDLESIDATSNWQEQAFSDVRGWPVSAAFHQDRLVIGGSRSLPNRLWFSKSGDLWNFDLGEGLDDEAIEFSILSDQVNAIRAVFSGRHLQVFTSGAEWMVTGNPLTPETVQLNRQTRIGSISDRTVPPVDVDGATLFAARNKRELREFLYTDVEQAYSSTDLALLARHIMTAPIDQDFDQKNRLLFIVREDGKLASLTIYRAEAVTAWTMHETAGDFISVAVVGDEAYVLIDRAGVTTIEVFDERIYLDAALEGEAQSPATVWSGLDHLEGRSVSIVADGVVQDPLVVSSGSVTLGTAASHVVIGLSYTHIIEPLPPSILTQGGAGRAVRMVEAIFRVQETAYLKLDIGTGLKDIPLQDMSTAQLDTPPPEIDGDIRVRAYGWLKDHTKGLWRVEQDAPLPFTLLSVTAELKIND